MTGRTGQPDALSHASPEDEAIVRALRTRHTDALTRVYDRYGPLLFDYCHALLRDEPYASRVLHDTLLAAQAHIERLGSAEQLRTWLYALARRECRRIMNGPDRPVQRRPAPEVPDDFRSYEEHRRYYEARVLAHDALRELTGRQREALDLTFRHGFAGDELARVMGIPPDEAAALAEGSCEDLADALEARVGHRRIQLGRLMSVLPAAMAPPNLQQRVLASALDPGMDEDRARIARRALPFDADGWPCEDGVRQGHRAPAAAGGSGGRKDGGDGTKAPSVLWPLAGAAAVAVILGALFLLRPGEDRADPQAADTGMVVPSYGQAPVEAEEPDEKGSGPREASESPKPSRTPSKTPSPSATTGSPSPTKKPRPSSRPSTTEPAPVSGRLVFSSTTCVITYPSRLCTVGITAAGGPVKWSAEAYGEVSGGGSGTLAEGRTRVVFFRVTRPAPCLEGEIFVPFEPSGGVQVSWDCPPQVEVPSPPGNGNGPGDGEDEEDPV